MTQDEFLHRYYDWISQSGTEARFTAVLVNKIGVDDATIVPVKMHSVGWCLMLKESAEFLLNECGMSNMTIIGEES